LGGKEQGAEVVALLKIGVSAWEMPPVSPICIEADSEARYHPRMDVASPGTLDASNIWKNNFRCTIDVASSAKHSLSCL
jgi:hypothetical protein